MHALSNVTATLLLVHTVAGAASVSGIATLPRVLVRPGCTAVIRRLPEQVLVPQCRVEKPVNASTMAPKLSPIEVLAQPRHKGAEHLWTVDVNPLLIDRLARSLASFEKPRTPIEIRALSDVEDSNNVLETPLKTSPHHKIAECLCDGRGAGRCVRLGRDTQFCERPDEQVVFRIEDAGQELVQLVGGQEGRGLGEAHRGHRHQVMHKHIVLEEIDAELFNRECAVAHLADKRVRDHPVPQVVMLMTQLLGQCHMYVPSNLITTVEAVCEGILSFDRARQYSVRLHPPGEALPLGGIL